MNRIQRLTARPAAPSRLLPTASALATVGLVAAFVGGALNAQALQTKTVAKKSSRPKANASKTRLDVRRAMLGKVTVGKAATAKRPVGVASTVKVAEGRKLVVQGGKVTIATGRPITIEGGSVQATKAVQSVPTGWAITTDRPAISGEAALAKRAEEASTRWTIGIAPDAARAVQKTLPAAPAGRAPASGSSVAVKDAPPAQLTPARASTENVSRAVARPFPPFLEVERLGSGDVNITAKSASFTETITELAKATQRSVVVEGDRDSTITAVLHGQSFESAMEILCRAGKATYHFDGTVYVVTTRS